jgi:hypothetical protein
MTFSADILDMFLLELGANKNPGSSHCGWQDAADLQAEVEKCSTVGWIPKAGRLGKAGLRCKDIIGLHSHHYSPGDRKLLLQLTSIGQSCQTH